MEKVALVTGASGGIGLAVVERLIEEGYYVYAQYRRNNAALQLLLENEKNKLVLVKADLTIEADIDQMTESMPPLDAFVHCAGDALYGFGEDYSQQQIHRLWTVHVSSLITIMQKLSYRLRQKEHSSVVVVSSIWGDVGASLESVYASVKGAQLAFVKSMAKEWASSHTRVNAVLPGIIQTKMNDAFTEAEIADIIEQIPLNRLGTAADVAGVIAFLLSTKASYLTGQLIRINGGWEG